jgi:anaerobic C4-dicarboxylate transporter
LPRFLYILLIIVTLIFLTRTLFRIVFPILMNQFIEKGRKQDEQYRTQKKEGTVTVDKAKNKSKKISKDEGDYVNYKDV